MVVVVLRKVPPKVQGAGILPLSPVTAAGSSAGQMAEWLEKEWKHPDKLTETEHGQRVPDMDAAQQLKLKERQRFFEEVFQHDVDLYLSSAHLTIRDYRRPPIGSISSMEVNVDMLDQMELVDVSDQDALDVFLSSGGEEGALASPLPVQGNNNNEEVIRNGLFRHVLEGLETKSRMSSTSSNSSCNSQNTNDNGGNTPVVQSDDEETQANTVPQRVTPPGREKVYSLCRVTCSELLSRERRSWIIDAFRIEEGHPGPFPYVLGKLNIERTYGVYFELYGEGVDEEPKGVFSLHRESGILSVNKAVDYEEQKTFRLKFEARKTDLSMDTQLGVEIDILDINDNPPRFQRDLYEISIEQNTAQGSHLLTVVAYDRDQAGTPNSTFHYEIKSVSPNPPNAEFFVDELGSISFKGCLDYEAGGAYTVLVEAKDHGEVVSLSSSTTVLIHVQDGNNHLPTISGQTGSGKVKEGETGSSLLRLHVTDRDTQGSPAWRARYSIHGDKGGHFKIETDPDTNDGILTVVKPLDFEEGAERELSISVENEVPFFSCQVKERTSSGLWAVATGGMEASSVQPHFVDVTVRVEDANDPPEFSVTVREAVLEENAPMGTWVETVTAVDPDSSHARDFVYMIGSDPDGWVALDPNTGHITTAKIPDRESPRVVNGVYTIMLHAVDSGKPPMTGTATLLIHVKDQNDNVPQLTMNHMDMCVTDGPSSTNITAFDLDDEPFGGPFRFELLGDVKGKWRLNLSYGYTVDLVKEPSVYAGPHTLELKISDMQGQFAIHSLSVTVCDCSVTPNCRSSRATATKVSYGAIGIVLATLFVLLFLLLLSIIISCKKKFATLQIDGTPSGETLLASNIENPGTDCKRLSFLQETEEELGDCQPHLYADEGVSDNLSEPEHIYISNETLNLSELQDLSPKFNQLASVCKPPHVLN
ncbi:cadherin-like protein 26 [Diretmus argenteus]